MLVIDSAAQDTVMWNAAAVEAVTSRQRRVSLL